MSNSRLRDLLNLYRVPRWCLVTTLRPQSVAEHSFNVAAIAIEISDRLPGGAPLDTVRMMSSVLWAVVHDGPEAETGDVPYPVKKMFNIKEKVDLAEAHLCPWYVRHDVATVDAERAIVKIADKCEEYLWLNKFGWGDEAASAMNDAYRQIVEHVEAARSRYGWDRLDVVISDILNEQLSDTSTDLRQRRQAALNQVPVPVPDPRPVSADQGPASTSRKTDR